jgi:hypothetical protein
MVYSGALFKDVTQSNSLSLPFDHLLLRRWPCFALRFGFCLMYVLLIFSSAKQLRLIEWVRCSCKQLFAMATTESQGLRSVAIWNFAKISCNTVFFYSMVCVFWHPHSNLNIIDKIFIPLKYTFFRSSIKKNSEVKRVLFRTILGWMPN